MTITKKTLISDIHVSINLLNQYSKIKGINAEPLISSIIDNVKDKNLIDLYVLREYIKDEVHSLLSAELEEEGQELENTTDDVDFNTQEFDETGNEDDLIDAGDSEEPNDFETRKQDLLNKAAAVAPAADVSGSRRRAHRRLK